MKKILLSAMCAVAAMSLYAQTPTVIYQDDFEWLEPWSSITPAGRTVEENNEKATAQQLGNSSVTVDGVTAYEALLAKGYSFPVCCAPKKANDPREAKAQTYLQRNYLKFGLTGYYSGLTFPAMDANGGTVTFNFDYCKMRQGSGKWDDTDLIIEVVNGADAKQFAVPFTYFIDGQDYLWVSASVELTGAVVTPDTKITIRNCDEQWPDAGTRALRWFIDNIVVTSTGGASVEAIAVEDAAPEYFNLQGIRVANPQTGLYLVRKGDKVSKVIVK